MSIFYNNYWIYLVWNHGLISAITKAFNFDQNLFSGHRNVSFALKHSSPGQSHHHNLSFYSLKSVTLFYFLKYIYYIFPLCAGWRWHRKSVNATKTWLFSQAMTCGVFCTESVSNKQQRWVIPMLLDSEIPQMIRRLILASLDSFRINLRSLWRC